MIISKHQQHSCNEDECFPCRGGLYLCTVCGGAEASLPTECPGRRMTADEMDNVQSGNIDYRGGQFICLDPNA